MGTEASSKGATKLPDRGSLPLVTPYTPHLRALLPFRCHLCPLLLTVSSEHVSADLSMANLAVGGSQFQAWPFPGPVVLTSLVLRDTWVGVGVVMGEWPSGSAEDREGGHGGAQAVAPC